MSQKTLDLSKYKLMKGDRTAKITAILDGGTVETRYGTRQRIEFVTDADIKTSILVDPTKEELHPSTNFSKLMVRYNCKKPKQLIGREVELKLDSNGFWRIVF